MPRGRGDRKMKTYRIKGKVTTEASYPHSIYIDMKVDAQTQTEAGDKVWDMFNHPVGSEWNIEECL